MIAMKAEMIEWFCLKLRHVETPLSLLFFCGFFLTLDNFWLKLIVLLMIVSQWDVSFSHFFVVLLQREYTNWKSKLTGLSIKITKKSKVIHTNGEHDNMVAKKDVKERV